MNQIAIAYRDKHPNAQLEGLANQLRLPLIPLFQPSSYEFLLIINSEGHLQLHQHGEEKINPIEVDFVSEAFNYRRFHGGGRGELIARACGLKKTKHPLTVLDVTAGFGRDAFILASLGCRITAIERSPIMAALLHDGLRRLFENTELTALIEFKLIHTNSLNYLAELTDYPDIILIDPMHPLRTKSALVKKEMRLLRQVVGDDVDADRLLETALGKAKKRIVVKRPRLSRPLAGKIPSLTFAGKSIRFDVYLSDP